MTKKINKLLKACGFNETIPGKVVIWKPPKNWRTPMNIDLFCRIVAKKEGKKKQVNIAQIKEVLRCIRKIILHESCKRIDIYKIIRKL